MEGGDGVKARAGLEKQADMSKNGAILQVGDTLQLIPGHCDPTVNLYDCFVVVEEGAVVAVPPIEGRGPGI